MTHDQILLLFLAGCLIGAVAQVTVAMTISMWKRWRLANASRMDGPACKGGVNEKPTTPPPATAPKGQGGSHEIKDDAKLVAIIDDIKHYIKAGVPYSPLRKDFNEVLNVFIEKWHLDEDPHNHATLPKNGVWSAETQKQIDETLKMGEELVRSLPPRAQEEKEYVACCAEYLPRVNAIHKSCEHAALNGVGIKLPAFQYCPWCGKCFKRKERPMGPNGEVGLDYADYLLDEIKKGVLRCRKSMERENRNECRKHTPPTGCNVWGCWWIQLVRKSTPCITNSRICVPGYSTETCGWTASC